MIRDRMRPGATGSLAREIEQLEPWFHNLHLPDGTHTAPNHFLGDFPYFKWAELAQHLPEDLSGWKVLDIGCNAGFYSFELAKRGADVLGIDLDQHYLRQARWAAGKMGLTDKVQFAEMQVYDLAHTSEQYDLVIFMGVLYHLRYPMLGLDIVARKVRKLMVFQTLSMPGREVFPGPNSDSLYPNGVPSWQTYSYTVPQAAAGYAHLFYHDKVDGTAGNGSSLGTGMAGQIDISP